MKTIFILNPKAGSNNNIDRLLNNIKETDAAFYITKSAGDAYRFVKDFCNENGPARFIACGGDGTLNEVINGAIGCDGAEIGVMPFGTGNDFCRNFSGDFTNVASQISGTSIKCDAIKYTTDGYEKYCANMFNIGFDCNVADMTATMKTKPFISGPLAYFVSIFVILIKKKGANLKIEIDGEEVHNGRLLLTSIANGNYCGGGIKCNPLASVHDGLLNVNIVYNISRLNFLTKLPFYMKGTHIKLPRIDKVIHNEKCKKIVITPLEDKMRLCIDGEISTASKTVFEIVPNAFNFVIPVKQTIEEFIC